MVCHLTFHVFTLFKWQTEEHVTNKYGSIKNYEHRPIAESPHLPGDTKSPVCMQPIRDVYEEGNYSPSELEMIACHCRIVQTEIQEWKSKYAALQAECEWRMEHEKRLEMVIDELTMLLDEVEIHTL